MYHKGIVMKIKDNYAIVLSDGNEFNRIRLKNNLDIGQKIMYTDDDIIDSKHKWRMMTRINKNLIVAAAALFLIISGGSISLNNFMNQRAVEKVVALITVDINPSIKVYVNEVDKVAKVESLNDDGDSLNLTGIIGVSIDEAIETIVREARVDGFINDEDLEDDYVLITMIPVEEEKKEKIEEIENLMQEKIVESDELQKVNVAMIEATMNQLSEAENKSIPVGLLAANNGVIDDKLMSVKDFFASKERIAEFSKTGKIIEQHLEKKVELIRKYLNELEAEGVNVENLQTAFDLTKEDLFETKKLYELARKEYQDVLISGNREKITSEKILIEEVEKYENSMKQNKDDVESIKEQIKNQLETLEIKVDTEQKKREEEQKRLEEKQKREEEQRKEEEKRLEEKQKREEEQRKEEEKRLEEKQKREEEQRNKEKKSLENYQNNKKNNNLYN